MIKLNKDTTSFAGPGGLRAKKLALEAQYCCSQSTNTNKHGTNV